jgi:hypothetical protein
MSNWDRSGSWDASFLSISQTLVYLPLPTCRRVGMSYDNAMALMLRRRPTANPIPEFCTLLRELASSPNTAVVEPEEKTSYASVITTIANDVKEDMEKEVVQGEGPKRTREHGTPPAATRKRVATSMIGPQRPPNR